MFISTEEEQISLPLENGESSPQGFKPYSLDGPGLPEYPSFSAAYTDVPVVPEHLKNEVETKISELEEEVMELKLKKRSLDETRREALNKILDTKGSIRVFCRVRPLLTTKKRRIHQPILVEPEKIVVKYGGSVKEFGFDKVFKQETSQEDVFVEVKPILRSALDGHNVCVLAYGQTSTGKTFTMEGTNNMPGIVPRALEELFCQASLETSASFTFSISMLEVYLGHLRDLLAPKSYHRAYEPATRCNLNIQTDPKGMVEVEGLTEVEISNSTKASWWYTKGRRVRSTSWTNVNEASSRSHCLTRITIFRRGDLGGKVEVSKLWMVDLGGSERLLKTGATGQTLDEGRAINLSLSALGDVIAALRRRRGHVPYRNSKLTQILRDSLGDGSKVLMVAHISQSEEDIGETTYSLTFAKRARAVESNREISEDLKKQKEKRIAELEEEMRHSEEECRKIGNQLQKAELLLSEHRKLFSNSDHLKDDMKNQTSPIEEAKEAPATPRKSEKAIRRNTAHSLPRFMNSTMASRQRQGAAEREVDSRVKMLRSTTRTSIHVSSSQSLSYTDPRFRSFLRNSNKKLRCGETNAPLNENTGCNAVDSSRPTTVSRSRLVTSSDPNLKTTLARHRRRMSNLI